MADTATDTSTSTAPSTAPPPQSVSAMQSFDPQAYLRSLEANAQAQRTNTSGMTQVGPQVNNPFPRQKVQFNARGLPGIVMGIVGKLEQRKARERQQVFDNFAGNMKGIQESQSQLQELAPKWKEATRQLQSDPSNPENVERVRQIGAQIQQLQGALKTSQTNLDDMFNGPKGEKHAKMLAKGFGIDDKNAQTPERQNAIAAIKKQMGVGDKAANIMSRLPQRQQLSPQAQAQSMMQQAGVVGKPATAGQELTAGASLARTQQQAIKTQGDQLLKAEQIGNKAGLDTQAQIDKLPSQGLKEERDDKGNVLRNPDGTIKVRNLTMDELKDNPVLAEKYAEEESKNKLRNAQIESTLVRAKVAQMKEQRLRASQALAAQPAYIKNWADLVTDKKSGVTLAQVPKEARGAVVAEVARGGKKIEKQLTGDEFKRMDLATNAILNLDGALEILNRRPDLFGPSGWSKTKINYAFNGGDPDAIAFKAYTETANLPLIGVHNIRAKYAMEQLGKLDSNLYENQESARDAINVLHKSAEDFAASGGRPETKAAPASSSGSQKITVTADDMK